MVDASGAAHRLGLVTVLLIGSGCVDVEPPQTRPSALSQAVTSCEGAKPAAAFQLPVWDLFVVDEHWNALFADVKADVEVDAQLCMNGVLEPIELELQGTSGRTRDKKSFKIKFKRDHALSEVGFEAEARSHALIDKVYLKAVWIDQSMIREALAFDLWREMGHKAPRSGFANLRINGDYWGLYNVVEPVDDEYLERNDYPANGHLYKATRKHGSRADFVPGRNLEKAFEDKTDDGPPSRADLGYLVETLQETPLDEESFERDIDPIFPIDDYLDRMIWVSLTRNGDAVAQNYYLYNAPRDGHDHWYLIPWDSDLCMGANWRDRDAVVPSDVSLMLDGRNYYGRRLTMVPSIRERYVERFHEVLDEVLPEAVMRSHLEARAARVRVDLMKDQGRWQRHVTPDEAFDVIRNFVAERPGILRTALQETFAESNDNSALTESTPDVRTESD
ncbi:MAG TPA: CotH kinase family protein [Polyangiales bacterium]|nr:CotH kinase family protein [Polyangiales bacterium]